MKKILAIVGSCKTCPNRKYYSGGIHECNVTNTNLDPNENMPSWCPLTDYSSREIEENRRLKRRVDELEEALRKRS